MNYSYINSSSILWIGSRYCPHVQYGMLHFPTFINDSLWFDGICASSVWWHLLQFTSKFYHSVI